ncbi:FecR family protein [Mucilaginibacter sp. dw_454]|uniref:FecR family protein n=1 Tax=Mucilaginibacter sp. dw_454 TaxID=2720079 RepID=UPI001BD621A3|nr:FecR family protein [Mucilaginibacter sp. dw_454]
MKEIDKPYFAKLLKRYRKGIATAEEMQVLESFYKLFEVQEELISDQNETEFRELQAGLKRRIDAKIDESHAIPHIFSYRKLAVRLSAAAILLLIGGGVFFWTRHANQQQTQLQAKNTIQPGGNRATLLLANGTRIDLTTASKGVIATQANIAIHKNAQGLLVYTVNPTTTVSGSIGSNTISTPRGGQYEIVLPDETHVTLNAASSLSYPVVFAGNERVVELTGEAYFEVSKDKTRPFKVKSNSQTVTVLGTHFNINAYADEAAVKTTLLEGSVEVSAGNAAERIIPGQQAVLGQNGQIIKKTVDLDKEIAWKNGLFAFDGDDLKTIMRQISRWYNVDIDYAGSFPEERFYGEIARSSKLTDVLRIMEINHAHFEIEGRRLTVSYAPPTN